MVDERPIRERWLIVRDELDERARRLWAAAEARSHGRGGIAAVVRATGISEATVRRGIAEVESGERAPEGRVRRPGAGRPSIEEREPGLEEALLALLEGATRGDPESPLLWTSRSVAHLTAALRGQGFVVHESTVRRQLHGLGFSLQANRKTHEGSDHPDRDGQFRRIAEVSAAALAAGEPLISVDTKKKELVGNYKNGGRELAPTGRADPRQHARLPRPRAGQGDPVRDLRRRPRRGLGLGRDLRRHRPVRRRRDQSLVEAARALSAIRRRRALTITADCGGSNGYRTRLWKTELQRLADQTGLRIRVLHYPPGTSKWNKIEHRLFSYISINWRAKPLLSRQTVIDLIASTTTRTGLKVYARLDPNTYPTKSTSPTRR